MKLGDGRRLKGGGRRVKGVGRNMGQGRSTKSSSRCGGLGPVGCRYRTLSLSHRGKVDVLVGEKRGWGGRASREVTDVSVSRQRLAECEVMPAPAGNPASAPESSVS